MMQYIAVAGNVFHFIDNFFIGVVRKNDNRQLPLFFNLRNQFGRIGPVSEVDIEQDECNIRFFPEALRHFAASVCNNYAEPMPLERVCFL